MTMLDRSFAFSSSMTHALTIAAALAILPACTGGGSSSDAPPGGQHDGNNGNGNGDENGGGTNESATAFIASGRVVDTQGNPLPNVEIFADNQFIENSVMTGKTGSDGRYRIELSQAAATWHMSATHTVEYHGRTYSFPLHPSDDSAFAGNTGGVRDFAWKLKGERPDGGSYGAFVVGYTEPGEFDIDLLDVELTLVPDGPLVDGSEGDTVTGKLVPTGDGEAIKDIPLGRYTITAKLGDTPLMLRIRNSGDSYATSLTSDFDAPYGDLPIYNLAVELTLP